MADRPPFSAEAFDRHVMATYYRFPVALARGVGCRVWDTDDRPYLDFAAGIATCTLGHAHPALVEAARAQIGRLHHVSNLYYVPEQGELAAWISHLGHNGLWNYIDQGCIPGGTNRNLKSYGEKIDSNSEKLLPILADPQTCGGLLVAISPEHLNDIQTIFKEYNLDKYVDPIRTMINSQGVSRIKISRP